MKNQISYDKSRVSMTVDFKSNIKTQRMGHSSKIRRASHPLPRVSGPNPEGFQRHFQSMAVPHVPVSLVHRVQQKVLCLLFAVF